MNFTSDELRMIEQLRKRETWFHRWRWPLIVFNGCMVIGWFTILLIVIKFPDNDETTKLLILVYFLPVCFVSLILSSMCVGYLISRWRGDTKTRLLLKIADKLQERDAELRET